MEYFYMKKTLIALAVLAASGASFAQVTISGNLAMGYRATTTGAVGASSDSAGFGVDTSEIDFAATEDLGGGMKATAKLALAGADRSGESNPVAVAAGVGNNVTGRDATLTLQTNAGALVLGSVSAADYLSGAQGLTAGFAGVGAYYNGWDGKVLSGRTNRDTVTYIVPVGAVSLFASYQETSVQANQGLGLGTAGTAGVTGQSLTVWGATYAKGAANANFTYLNFNAKGSAGATKDQTRLSGNYDFGAAKLGLGAVVTNTEGGALVAGKTTDMLLGVAVPMGALTLGVEFAQRKLDDMAALSGGAVAANGTVNGTSLQATYALSKRTAVIGNYARWTSYTNVNADASSQFNLLLSHSF
ncbi:MAG: porin [Rhodoferax sp.]